jgi:hypothetical protein
VPEFPSVALRQVSGLLQNAQAATRLLSEIVIADCGLTTMFVRILFLFATLLRLVAAAEYLLS